jgi:hypothetical protein
MHAECGPFAACLKSAAGLFSCKFTCTGLLVTKCGHRVSVGIAASDQSEAHSASCPHPTCPDGASEASHDGAPSSGVGSIASIITAGLGGPAARDAVAAEAQLPGLQASALEEEMEAQEVQVLERLVLLREQQKQQSLGGGQQQQQSAAGHQVGAGQQRLPQPVAGAASSSGGSSSHAARDDRLQEPLHWSLRGIGASVLRRVGRHLQQTLFPEGLGPWGMNQLYPNIQANANPNMPFGTGRVGQFASGLLDTTMNSQQVLGVMSRLVDPSLGGPIATSRFVPASNPGGNLVNTGGGPGGLMVRAGPGGLAAGAYGGGWVGPYNQATGQYAIGSNYGFARPYFGRAQGSAVVLMPANQSPTSPNITYPCPVGRGNGSIISPGMPCGIPLTAVPAGMLPTINGMPAAMDITPFAVRALHTCHGCAGNSSGRATACL